MEFLGAVLWVMMGGNQPIGASDRFGRSSALSDKELKPNAVNDLDGVQKEIPINFVAFVPSPAAV